MACKTDATSLCVSVPDLDTNHALIVRYTSRVRLHACAVLACAARLPR